MDLRVFIHVVGSLSGMLLLACCRGQSAAPIASVSPERAALEQLVLPADDSVPADVTNQYADNPSAQLLGKKFFFDPRFSGPLLDDANNGNSGTLGSKGETGKVSCAGCHVPSNRAFVDTRSTRGQLSFASGWTHRKAPTLLDVAQTSFLTWDGRRDSAYSQPFAPIESPVEFNSSRLFVAQQIIRHYRAEYEAVFGPLPALGGYAVLDPSSAGCTEMPQDPVHTICDRPGRDDELVTRVVANFGKAIQAYTRLLTCGRSRFDEWMEGRADALNAEEQAGAKLFVTKAGCNVCHSGPHLTDHRFHNIGVPGRLQLFTGVNTENDPGAAAAQAELLKDRLNSKGPFSDGDDGRLETIPADLSTRLGAFRTPTLRCVSRRPSFMHNAEFRSLSDVVAFFSAGGATTGFVGTSVTQPRNLTAEEQVQLVAFLKALDGSGPDPALIEPPQLP